MSGWLAEDGIAACTSLFSCIVSVCLLLTWTNSAGPNTHGRRTRNTSQLFAVTPARPFSRQGSEVEFTYKWYLGD